MATKSEASSRLLAMATAILVAAGMLNGCGADNDYNAKVSAVSASLGNASPSTASASASLTPTQRFCAAAGSNQDNLSITPLTPAQVATVLPAWTQIAALAPPDIAPAINDAVRLLQEASAGSSSLSAAASFHTNQTTLSSWVTTNCR